MRDETWRLLKKHKVAFHKNLQKRKLRKYMLKKYHIHATMNGSKYH